MINLKCISVSHNAGQLFSKRAIVRQHESAKNGNAVHKKQPGILKEKPNISCIMRIFVNYNTHTHTHTHMHTLLQVNTTI